MGWTGRVLLDADKENVGSATAVWNEGEADECSYSRRARVTQADAEAFAAEAIAARDAREAQGAREATLAATLTTILNDAEAGS